MHEDRPNVEGPAGRSTDPTAADEAQGATEQALQPQATPTGYVVTFTLTPQGRGMPLLGRETPEQRYYRASEKLEWGGKLHDESRLTEALAAYDEAIRWFETLDLNVEKYRYVLALAHYNKSVALIDLGTPSVLTAAVAACDRAIRLRATLDLSEAKYRNDLARAHSNKGFVLRAQGTPQSLAAAVAAFDEAIRLYKTLDLTLPEYRHALAGAHSEKGTALQMGTPPALTAAVAAYDEAIRLRATLDLSVAEYRHALAGTYKNKGAALKELGTPSALTDAVAACDEAIRLYETLDLSVAEYRHALAGTYDNKGLALRELGTPHLTAAVAAHDRAIRLYGALDLALPKYRNDLARAHDNKGTALADLDTPLALTAAVAAYDEAIQLYETLDLSMAEYRHALARAHTYKGVALRTLGTPKALTAAVAAYDEAIRWFETLDLSMAEYRHDLVRAHNNKGLALSELATPPALTAAVAAYDEAIRLGATLDLNVVEYRTSLIGAYANKGILPTLSRPAALDLFQKAIALAEGGWNLSITRIQVTARAYRGAAVTYLRLADPLSAVEAADKGLSLLRDLERDGIFKLRSLREGLFETALNATVQAQQFQLLSEIIQEHLDPGQPGSAPASEAMHAAAWNALFQSLTTLYQAPRRAVANTLTDLEALAGRLAIWRTRYFSGEATSAWLRALDCERRGLLEQAEALIRDHIQKRPLDPNGPKILGDWYVRRRQPAAAEAAYHEAARVCVHATPPRDDLHARGVRVTTLARCLLDLRLLQLSATAPAAATPPDPIATLGKKYDKLLFWLMHDFVDGLFKNANDEPGKLPPEFQERWRKRLQPELEALWEHRAAPQRDDWLTQHAQGLVEEERNKAFEVVLTLTKGLFQGLGRSWDDCRQAVSCALAEIWDYQTTYRHQSDLEKSDLEKSDLEGLVTAAVREAVERAAQALADSELETAYERLGHTLDPLWERVLEDQEKRFLGCGWRSLQHLENEDLRRFAGLNFGLAVEWSLNHRLYQPLKAYWAQSGKPDLGDRGLAPRIRAFLDRPNQPLMLGDMVGALNSALKHAQESPDGLPGLIVAYLHQQLPNATVLLAADASTRTRRREQLEEIKRYRNDCAHPKEPPSQEELATLWTAVAADPDAFFRYFGAACLPPDLAPPSGDR